MTLLTHKIKMPMKLLNRVYLPGTFYLDYEFKNKQTEFVITDTTRWSEIPVGLYIQISRGRLEWDYILYNPDNRLKYLMEGEIRPIWRTGDDFRIKSLYTIVKIISPREVIKLGGELYDVNT